MPKRAACHPWLDCQLHVRRGECPPSFALTLSFDGFDQIMGCRAEICRFAFGFFFVQSRRRSSKKGPQRTCNVSSSKKHRCRKNRESTQSFIGNSNYSIGGPIMIHGRAPVPTPIPRRRDPRGSRHDPPARPIVLKSEKNFQGLINRVSICSLSLCLPRLCLLKCQVNSVSQPVYCYDNPCKRQLNDCKTLL